MFTPNAFQATLGQHLAGGRQAVVLGRQDTVPHLRQKRKVSDDSPASVEHKRRMWSKMLS